MSFATVLSGLKPSRKGRDRLSCYFPRSAAIRKSSIRWPSASPLPDSASCARSRADMATAQARCRTSLFMTWPVTSRKLSGKKNAAPAILAGHAFGHFVAKMTAVDYPQIVRAVVLIGAAQKKPDPAVQRAVAVATDPSQPEAERLKNLKLVFFATGNDPAPWLTGFHANVRAA
jgi:hypothetical protein